MQTHWPVPLDELGATSNDRGDAVFAAAPPLATLLQHTTVMPLPYYAVFAVQGTDSAKFLQGQLTCDVLAASATHSTPGAYCSQKGRMLSSFQLVRRADDIYWLRMRSDLLENTIGTLSKYIVFSKAKLIPQADVVAFGLHGSGAKALLQNLFGIVPAGNNGTAIAGDTVILQRDAAATWFECWMPSAVAIAFWQSCRAHCEAAGSDLWRWLTIRSGYGEVAKATAEMFIPQMLNYHLNDAVNFKKGCYTGQEIIARTHYRGQVKRHVQRAQCALSQSAEQSDSAPTPGSEVIGANGHAIGNVLDSVAIDREHAELLVVLADSDPTQNVNRLAISGAALTPLPLPYAIN